ncbi:TRAP-type C4-dicarboxylate transport system,small permease component [Halanaerobium saccharolyticum subsp. saccharolyticum DSM 6643]|uniref:TRAP-type C4-dicarboxylate transport system,small permease component n=1 Tax=Halanaerobium saccharolyticum subsp. saccharolyticum DSM 6643 TaxID=1293054 RepID=M5E308_9FIRM|nr:TRAP-type C4-dicarboxylate transport system,small permease component [Halanaerobium saccharolyticum subsp. saccharolyticum DSM 6643]
MLKRLKKILFYTTESLAAFSLFAMLVVVTYQVIARYMPNMTIPSWTEELARFILIYIIAFAGGLAIEKKAYVGMDSFYMMLPFRGKKVLDLLFNIMTGYLFYIILKYGYDLMLKVKIQLTPAMRISMSYIYFSLPLLGFLVLLFIILDSLATIKSLIKNEEVMVSTPDEHLIYYVSEEEKIRKLEEEKADELMHKNKTGKEDI